MSKKNNEKQFSKLILVAFIFFIVIIVLPYVTKQQSSIPQKQPTTGKVIVPATKLTSIYKNNKSEYYLFEYKELNISFMYPYEWGQPFISFWEGSPQTQRIGFSKLPENNKTVIYATNPTNIEPLERTGGYMDGGRNIKSEDDLKKICSKENNDSCKTYKNKNGITVVKKQTYSDIDINSNNTVNVYSLYTPN